MEELCESQASMSLPPLHPRRHGCDDRPALPAESRPFISTPPGSVIHVNSVDPEVRNLPGRLHLPPWME
jgi:hypothetical protein